MDRLFLAILNMSLTGAFVITAICLARLPLKKAPKIISYCLWAVAGFRLVFPFSIESIFSLVPFKAASIPPDIATQAVPRIDSGIPFVNNAVSSILPAATSTASVNPLQIWTAIGAYVWFTGAAIMFVYGVVSFIILKRKMQRSVHIHTNIYEADNIQTPFVLGIFKPKIYLPPGLPEHVIGYILLHEQTHIRRRDHIVKLAAYFVLCLHWFNPFVWVAFLLMGVDMEMSCDERVLKEMGSEIKKDYSMSLLSLVTERRIIGGSPLAFGEGGVRERVKNILNFRKSSRMIIVAAVALATVLSIGFTMNRGSGDNSSSDVSRDLIRTLPESEQGEASSIISLYTASLTHDGSVQTIVLDTSRSQHLYTLRVIDASGRSLWETNAGLSHMNSNTILLTRIKGKDYLMQYNPYMNQGNATYIFRVFSLSKEGSEITLDQDEVSFSINPPWTNDLFWFGEENIESVKAFLNHLNQYLTVSELLVNTDVFGFLNCIPEEYLNRLYGTQSSPIRGLRGYFYGSSDWSVDDQMDAFLQTYAFYPTEWEQPTG